jgi:exodeoxyribonuclease VII small subunit
MGPDCLARRRRRELTEEAEVGHRWILLEVVVNGSERRAHEVHVANEAANEAKDTLSFEQIVEQLTAVVARLEDGELPLEQALLTFEQGVALSRQGSKRLDEAERRVELLLRDSQGIETRPFVEERKTDE